MKRFIATILSAIIISAIIPTKAAMEVALDGEFLSINASVNGNHTISYEFCRCMANHIYTFSRVLIDSTVVNEATSDNIGPFLIDGRGWTGGNHLLPDGKTPSAFTDRIHIVANRTDTLQGSFNGTAERIDIYVSNVLLDPACQSDTFCTEQIHYLICGNSIQVEASHSYLNKTPFKIARYYGMQSMMCGETEILTPCGAYQQWTPITHVDRFARQSAPHFHQFIEKSPVCYAAAFMTDDGIGDRHLIAPDDVVFIGNSWSKSYHKLIGGATIASGDSTHWRGIYTWFVNPIENDGDEFSYLGYYNGQRAIFSSRLHEKDKITIIE